MTISDGTSRPVKGILVFNADLIQKQERKVPNYQSLSKLSPLSTSALTFIQLFEV